MPGAVRQWNSSTALCRIERLCEESLAPPPAGPIVLAFCAHGTGWRVAAEPYGRQWRGRVRSAKGDLLPASQDFARAVSLKKDCALFLDDPARWIPWHHRHLARVASGMYFTKLEAELELVSVLVESRDLLVKIVSLKIMFNLF